MPNGSKYEKMLPCPKCGTDENLSYDALPGKCLDVYRSVRCGCGYVGPQRERSREAVKAFNRVPRRGLERSTASVRKG